jgi:hypothetical protein
MRRVILATIAAVALCAPAFAQQTNTGPQTGKQPPQVQNQPATQNRNQPQRGQNLANARQQISPERLSTTVRDIQPALVRDIQQALDKMGFKAGRVDGKWGPETEAALKDFQKSKNMPSNGQLDAMTTTGLGLNPSDFGTAGNLGTTGQAPPSSSSQFQGNSQGGQRQRNNQGSGVNDRNLGPNQPLR